MSDSGNGGGRRGFVKTVGLGLGAVTTVGRGDGAPAQSGAGALAIPSGTRLVPSDLEHVFADIEWPSFRHYDEQHLLRIALPIGGIGTGTVSLGGRGDLRDFEVMNRPGKGFVPTGSAAPFFAVRVQAAGQPPVARVLEGPLPAELLEGSHGSPAPNAGLQRFQRARFTTAYPFGRVVLEDPELPIEAHVKAMNPLVPGDSEASGWPVAVFRVELRNRSARQLTASVCASLPNFVGMDGSKTKKDWKGDDQWTGASGNRNTVRRTEAAQGVFLASEKVDRADPAWGSLALVTSPGARATSRSSWSEGAWSTSLLDFWDDFLEDGRLDERSGETDTPMASLAVERELPPGGRQELLFVLAWHFPNRMSWTPKSNPPTAKDLVGNHYTTRFRDAWEVAEKALHELPSLHSRTRAFVSSLLASDLPPQLKEAALFNLSTLRTQTCFRTEDGRFFGFEGCADGAGCCHGSCTHVWNYDQATPFLFGSLSRSLREVEFSHATGDSGLMSFRVNLPLGRAQEFKHAAADGQTGCILKMHRDWQLSGDDALLRSLWPKVKKAVEFCWVKGGWDADRDGVMEGCQHNTMDVEYYGPNPEMGLWYLGALRAAEEMARHVGDVAFAAECRRMFESGRSWIDANLWNGEYYEHRVVPPRSKDDIAPGLLVGMGAADVTKPDFQLATGCQVDQLVGQMVARICGLGSLVDPEHARTAVRSILKHNLRPVLWSQFNNMRAYAVSDESALVLADYPKQRPEKPFPYFGEAWTGLEYVAAANMIQEGLEDEGLRIVRAVRARYDGARRNPFDEAECGHHYARALSSWATLLALTGFRWSAVTGTLELRPRSGLWFWSNGSAFGVYVLSKDGERAMRLELRVVEGSIDPGEVRLTGFGAHRLEARRPVLPDKPLSATIPKTPA